MSFRARFVGAISAVNLITLAAAFTSVNLLVDASQQRQFDEALGREAREESAEIAHSGADRLRISPRLGPSPDDVGPLTKYAALYAEDGTVLDATVSWQGPPPAVRELGRPLGDFEFQGEHLRGLVIEIPGHAGVVLLLAAPRSDLDRDSLYLARVMGLVFGIAFLATILLTSDVVRRLTRVHDRIARVARRIWAHDLDARVGKVRAAPEIVQLAGDVDAMIERLATLLRARSDFIAHAAHELRSPLTALYGELSHALRRSRDAQEYRRSIEEALDATRRLKALTDELLALARIGRVPALPSTVVDLAQVSHEAAAMLAAEAERHQVDVVIRVEPMAVRADPMDLVRLIRNLLENAIGHAPPGSRVDLEGRPCDASPSPTAMLLVRDRGVGVLERDAEQIFQPFYRGASERASGRPGTGIGLTIAREIAIHHGGSLELERGSSLGACFVVRLPILPMGADQSLPR
ncbi:HAMP domain-containing sensor histidine kinase [Enhygromyxa salina]|uniref:histidine kinase n=1 Tax=Enhygromyxa salina TaxID=215803 RepID=A0A2S9XPP1_9BACT|nr:HAMP domain-containing sensor histidine kinase [Enhygromyxa salina]PRP94825.1 Sensor kinase CusS [Enhygromyxa salina]